MPADSGMAFVLIPHLAPEHKSIMAELLKRYTTMDVVQAEDGMRANPNCVYIIPPNKDMAMLKGTLQLLEPVERRGLRHPIDFFFRSLAEDQEIRPSVLFFQVPVPKAHWACGDQKRRTGARSGPEIHPVRQHAQQRHRQASSTISAARQDARAITALRNIPSAAPKPAAKAKAGSGPAENHRPDRTEPT
jgi:hypothetical protein